MLKRYTRLIREPTPSTSPLQHVAHSRGGQSGRVRGSIHPTGATEAEKWHDGSAKFHHFNNLLVLYDDSNHKIDSTFLGRGRVLEIGEELQIDNHLISLEDLTKTTTRDISGIYTREQNTGLGSNAPPLRECYNRQSCHM